ncbi:hypothetical protein OZ411_26125 [Bradyrhizobium sp. Arg237L]|uniref:hypothetical protein n=1 Tax=Bradyrhizobium sp. Arg237L TaxID=3003352 RepID=UPI00249DC15E|nr:hypothetical protein [Bradyrhizobium sp. Arg237L]MDI4236296.1 hypothetical protein [Bradyrhizobium sp. Arg237L]
MRHTEANAPQADTSTAWKALMHGLRLAAVALGVGLVMAAGPVRAGDDGDDEDDKTFEEKVIEGVMKGLGGTNMENRGIDYRERSPLVVPPNLNLPAPAASAEAKVPNWPKDPDEARRKAAIAARKNTNKDPREASRILSPSELAQKSDKKSSGGESVDQPGGNPGANAILSPSQLGYEGGFSGLFGGSKTETATFKSEPTRESLTQPPPGYQTPSPNFAYGTGPKESLNKEYNPSQGKYGD